MCILKSMCHCSSLSCPKRRDSESTTLKQRVEPGFRPAIWLSSHVSCLPSKHAGSDSEADSGWIQLPASSLAPFFQRRPRSYCATLTWMWSGWPGQVLTRWIRSGSKPACKNHPSCFWPTFLNESRSDPACLLGYDLVTSDTSCWPFSCPRTFVLLELFFLGKCLAARFSEPESFVWEICSSWECMKRVWSKRMCHDNIL